MRFVVLGLLCLMAVIAYVQRLSLTAPAVTVKAELNLDDAQWGLITAAWYLGYSVLQIPAGYAADRFGVRMVLAGSAVLWSVCGALSGLSVGFWSLLPAWFSMGLFQAAAFPCAARSIRGWFPASQRAMASGFLAASQAAGAAVAPIFAAHLLHHVSWHWLGAIYAVPCVVWAAMFLLIITESEERETQTSAFADAGLWSRLLRNPSLMLLNAQQFFRAAGMTFFFNWFPQYLQEVRELTVDESSQFALYVGLSGLVGSVAGGGLSDALLSLTQNRRIGRTAPAVAGLASCSLFLWLGHMADNATAARNYFCLASFLGTVGGINGYAVAIDLSGKNVGTVFGLMNMCGNLGATASPAIVGFLLGGSQSWDDAFVLVVGIFALDACLWAFLNPNAKLDPPAGECGGPRPAS